MFFNETFFYKGYHSMLGPRTLAEELIDCLRQVLPRLKDGHITPSFAPNTFKTPFPIEGLSSGTL